MYRRGEYGKRIVAGKRTLLATLTVCILCWLAGYGEGTGFPLVPALGRTPLWNYICRSIPSKETAYLGGFFLTLGAAFLLHRIHYISGLIREKTVFPFLFFMLFISTNPDLLSLNPALPGIFCLILGTYRLFQSYHEEKSLKNSFDWAFLIGIGSLFWVQILWFTPLFWFGMYQMRSLGIRSFLSSVFGMLAVYWLALGWCVWQNDYSVFTQPFGSFFQFHPVEKDWKLLAGTAYAALLTLVASLNILTHEHADNLRTREYLSFLIVFAIAAFLLYFAYDLEEFLFVTAIPSSILVSHFFTVTWNRWTGGLFYCTILIFICILFIRLWWNYL